MYTLNLKNLFKLPKECYSIYLEFLRRLVYYKRHTLEIYEFKIQSHVSSNTKDIVIAVIFC